MTASGNGFPLSEAVFQFISHENITRKLTQKLGGVGVDLLIELSVEAGEGICFGWFERAKTS